MNYFAFLGALEQGLVYGIMALGVYITFRILDFPDLTVDGSLPLGAAVSAVCLTKGLDPFLSLVFAMGAGFIAGAITGVLNTKLKILHLLASILTMTALYSVNIRIMNGPNLSLLGVDTVFDPLMKAGITGSYASLILFFSVVVFIVGMLVWFLHTEFGQTMLATGDNPQMITSQGVDTHKVIILGVGLANALVALAGGLIAQNQGAADVNMGVGTIVAGLASVIVGETIWGRGGILRCVVAVVIGSMVYRTAIGLALGLRIGDFSFSPSDLNLITAFLVIVALVAPKLKKRLQHVRA